MTVPKIILPLISDRERKVLFDKRLVLPIIIGRERFLVNNNILLLNVTILFRKWTKSIEIDTSS
jgi:hypothetical protein